MQPDQPSPEPGTAEQEPAGGSPVPERSRHRANRVAFTSAAAGLLAVAVIAAGTALASAGPHPSPAQAKKHLAHPAAKGPAPAQVRHLRELKREAARRAQAAEPVPAAKPAPPKPYGNVVGTGIRNKAGELVFYVIHVHVKQLPGTTFGLLGGFRNQAGHLAGAVETNETTGSDVSPGFHAIEAPVNGLPEFGYYAGPAATVTGTVGGQTIHATLAHWSVNPKVVIFWFSPTDDPQGLDVTSLAAVDAQGNPLPAGNSGVGHG